MIFAIPQISPPIEIPSYIVIGVDSSSTPPSDGFNYDPSPICESQVAPFCDSKIFKVFTQAGPKDCNADFIRSYTYTINPDNSNKPVWSNPAEVESGNCDPCGVRDSNQLDAYVSPDAIRLSNGNILFYVHGSADTYNGFIEYRYTPDNGIATKRKLIGISPCNINSCTCCGGFARVAALKDGNYYYIYFEVWIGVYYDIYDEKLCVYKPNLSKSLNVTCPERHNNKCETVINCDNSSTKQSIGHNFIFLARVKIGSDGLPEIASGSGQIWAASTNRWINLLSQSEITHIVCGHSSPGALPLEDDYYVFSWKQYDGTGNYYCPQDLGCIDYFNDNIFDDSRNVMVALGDVFKNSEGKYIAVNAASDSRLRVSISDISTFKNSYNYLLGVSELGFTNDVQNICAHPSIYEDGRDIGGNIKYKFFYSHMSANKTTCNWSEAVVKTAEMVRHYGKLPAPPKQPLFYDIFNNVDLKPKIYYDSNNDGILDEEINISLSTLKFFKGIKNYISAIQEDGYPILYLYTGCIYKKNGKIKCKGKDLEELEEIEIDEDNGILKILDTDLSIGDEFLLKLILRPYDPEEDKNNKKKEKKCKEEDRCIDLKFKIVE